MKITKDYGNSCLNYCVLHLFSTQNSSISKFHNLISTIFFPFLTDYNYLCPIRATAK